MAENNGTATVSAMTDYEDVAHGLGAITPSIVLLQALGDPGGLRVWAPVANRDNTNFRIQFDSITGVDLSFNWYAYGV